MTMKKVLIVHATAGSGHTKSAEAVYKAFSKLPHGLDIKLVNSLDYMTGWFKFTYPRIYVFLVNRIPLVWAFFYYALDNRFIYPVVCWIRHLTNWMNSRRLEKFLIKENADLIINTHFLAPDVISMAGKKKIRAHVATIITDYKLHSFWLSRAVDTYITAYEVTKESLVKRGVPKDKIKVLGLPIDPVFSTRHDRKQIRRKLGIKEDLFTVLVGSGGFGIGPVDKLITSLIGIDIPLQLLVVCGKNASLCSKIKGLENCVDFSMTSYGFVHNMHELMDASDIIVTKSGGLVCAEALSKDLPIIGIFPIPGQEARNLDVLEKQGAGIKLKRISDIKEVLAKFYKDKNESEKIKRAIERVKKPNASGDIAQLAINILKK